MTDSANQMTGFYMKINIGLKRVKLGSHLAQIAGINPVLANVPILYPLKTPKNLKTFGFLVFSRGIKWSHWTEISLILNPQVFLPKDTTIDVCQGPKYASVVLTSSNFL